jgi:excisionase family DNA binding protein
MTRLLLTVPEAAEALAISRSKLYELLASGAIASIRIDGSRRIPLSALEEYVSRLRDPGENPVGPDCAIKCAQVEYTHHRQEQESRRTQAPTRSPRLPTQKEYPMYPPSDDPRELITIDVTGYTQYQRSIILNAISEAQATLHVARPVEAEPTGWTKRAYEKALVKLAASRAEVQIQVVKRAIENGGSIMRAEVFELGGYPADRQLRGFTRSTNRATQELRESGDLPEDADELLAPIYDMTIKGYQQAKGFRVPQELVKLDAE